MVTINNDLDSIDRDLLRRLMRQGRATWADLAEQLGITAPAIAQRVRRLEDQGIIRQFAAWVDPAVVAPVTAYARATLDRPELRADFCRQVQEMEVVQECSRIAGDDEYVLKLRCRSTRQLEELLDTTLPRLPGVGRITASLVLSTVKETPVLPLAGGE